MIATSRLKPLPSISPPCLPQDYINSAQNTVVLLVLGSRVTHSILAPGKHEILALITGDKSDFEVTTILEL